MVIADSIRQIRSTLPLQVRLVAVSKTKPPEDMMEAYGAGQRLFGENKAQELAAKYPRLPADTEWHFIGHLQTNKVKIIAPLVSMIHSVDSLRLLQVIDREASLLGRVIPCLLEFRIAGEETKFGLSRTEAETLLRSAEFAGLRHVTIAGVMGMASLTDDMNQVRREFRSLRENFEGLKKEFFPGHQDFREISMGMSSDYHIAVEEGSTMVRIGTTIFSERVYPLS